MEIKEEHVREILEAIEEISLVGEAPELTSKVTKDEAQSFLYDEDSQVQEKMKIKGYVSKVDTKARSGYITTQSRRVPFTYIKTLKKKDFLILVESLKTKVEIFVVGNAIFDYESNIKSIEIQSVDSELKLFR